MTNTTKPNPRFFLSFRGWVWVGMLIHSFVSFYLIFLLAKFIAQSGVFAALQDWISTAAQALVSTLPMNPFF